MRFWLHAGTLSRRFRGGRRGDGPSRREGGAGAGPSRAGDGVGRALQGRRRGGGGALLGRGVGPPQGGSGAGPAGTGVGRGPPGERLAEAGPAWDGMGEGCAAPTPGKGLRLAVGRPLLLLLTWRRRERVCSSPITPPRRATSVSAPCLRSRQAAWRLLPSPRTLFLVIILYASTTLNRSQSSLRLEPRDGPEWLKERGLHHHFDGEEIEPGKGGGKGPDSVLGQTGFGPALVCSLQDRRVLPSRRM